MTSNNKLTNLRRGDRGTPFATCEVGERRTRTHNEEFKVNRVQRQCTNEPKLPKGYRHIRSAIEAVLECAREHVSGGCSFSQWTVFLNPKQLNKKHGEKNK